MPFFRSRSRVACRPLTPARRCTTSCGKKPCSCCRPAPEPACCPTIKPEPVTICQIKKCCCKKPQPNPNCKIKNCCCKKELKPRSRGCSCEVKCPKPCCQTTCGDKKDCEQPKPCKKSCCSDKKSCEQPKPCPRSCCNGGKSCEQPENCKTILVPPPPKQPCCRPSCSQRMPCMTCCKGGCSVQKPAKCLECKRVRCICEKSCG